MVAGILDLSPRKPLKCDFVGRKDVIGHVVRDERDFDGLGLLVDEFSVLCEVNHSQRLLLREPLVEEDLRPTRLDLGFRVRV